MGESEKNPYRSLPGVDELLETALAVESLARAPRGLVTAEIRGDLADTRELIRDAGLDGDKVRNRYAPERFLPRLAERVTERGRRVYIGAINATGVVLHTNLGRALLGEAAREALAGASGYTVLEVDRFSGRRNRREDGVSSLLRELTGAPDATVVNNCAAATLIGLAALAAGKEVIVARGQLVEIGGSYRIPDIMALSGCRMVEVGTTNRVRIADYENAITEDTGLLLKVHPSNFQIVGFTETVELDELVKLGRKRGIPVMDDLGSGCFVDLSPWGLPQEPVVSESVATGASLVTFSGDKLLGGPQAGLVLGEPEAVMKVKKHPYYRAMRPGKLTLSALEATLRAYRDPEAARMELPVLRMLTESPDSLAARAEAFAAVLELPEVELREDVSKVGGGSFSMAELPTTAIAISPGERSCKAVAEALRRCEPPVFVRVQDDRLLVDLRTVQADQEPTLAKALREVLAADDGAD